MPKGGRANLERLLRSAWERQTILLAKGIASNAAMPPKSTTGPFSPQNNQPFNLGDSIGFLGLLLAVIAMTVTPPFWWKVALLLLCVPCFYIFAQKSHFTHSWNSILQGIVATGAVIILTLIAAPQLIAQWQFEHPTSALEISALATNIPYTKGEKAWGIEWQDYYGELRITIVNSAEPTIQNVDLTIQADKGLIFEMKQLSDIPGVEFRLPDDSPNPSVRIPTGNGGTWTLTMRELEDFVGEKTPFPSNHWKIFCPRVLGKTQLRLVLAAQADTITGVIATKVRVFGNYELMPNEGSKIVKIDSEITVNH